jgi:hypothetical protein
MHVVLQNLKPVAHAHALEPVVLGHTWFKPHSVLLQQLAASTQVVLVPHVLYPALQPQGPAPGLGQYVFATVHVALLVQ